MTITFSLSVFFAMNFCDHQIYSFASFVVCLFFGVFCCCFGGGLFLMNFCGFLFQSFFAMNFRDGQIWVFL